MIEDNYNDDIELLDEPEVVDAGDGTLYEHWKIEVDPGQTPVRIDKFLSEKNPYQSRNRIQNAADAGFIHVNGKPVKSNYKVRPNDVITLMLDRPKHDTSIVAEDIPLNIVYEDDALMVVNKEAGMVVHPGAGNFTGTLINAVAWHMKDVKDFDPNDPEVGLVHRIDKNTSGLLVLARNRKYAELLTKAFREHQLQKTYLAFCIGVPRQHEGEIKGRLLKVGEKSVIDRDGKEAVTLYKVLDTAGNKFSLIAASPLTGRTHQIRAHLESIGCPIAGDDRYYGEVRQKFSIFADKLYLHAYKINLSALYNKKLEITAGLPDYFKESLKAASIIFKE